MLKELQEIDTSDVEALAAIKKDYDGVQALIEKANASRDKVAGPIYQRVMADYDARVKALEAQARPLIRKAGAELAKLKALHARLGQELEAAKLDLNELEFRHEIGELTDDVFAQRRQAAQDAVATCQAHFDEAEKLSQRFLEVLPPGTEAEAAPEPAPLPVAPEPSAPAVAPEPAEEAVVSEVTVLEEPPTLPPTMPPSPAPTPDSDEFGTIAVSREEAAAMGVTPEPVGGTMVMPGARLVRDDDGVDGPSYVLGLLTTVGRTPDNSIALEKPEVSRRHARIQLGPDGVYTLFDNNSNNGTYVNGDRITEHRLQEGDRVQIGTTYFVFRNR